VAVIFKRDSNALKCVFVCDFYKNDLSNRGGAENNDSVLISLLEKSVFEVQKKYSREITSDFIETNKNKKFIVSNFVGLSESAKHALQNKSYIIYEHDHKYLKTRDPSKFPNFIAPKDQVINRDFYANAQAVICLSNSQTDSVRNNLDISNVDSIGCSLWSSERLDFISSIANTPKEKDFCIVNSQNPTKGTREAIQFCQKNNISYDLIQSSDEKEFLTKLSQYKTLVFIPTVLESLCRLVVEAKMLNCKVMTKTQLLGASSEEWFDLNGEPLIATIRAHQDKAFNIFLKYLLS
jgi:ribosomal protein S17E